MKRRQFFQNTALSALGASFVLPTQACTPTHHIVNGTGAGKKAKNIIFMVSDGMSAGTLNMCDMYRRRKEGRGSNWIDLYRNQRVNRGLMDMASASSLVTDSAAASSSWGGGVRVKNGKLNSGPNGEEYLPIWQKFKKSGKKVGCVTTVPITHATPAGFCVSSKSRGEQAEIAEKYLQLRFDVMMGGGSKYFDGRKDNRDMYTEYTNAGFTVVRSKSEMKGAKNSKPILGVFEKEGLPFELDRVNDEILFNKVPSLAEMAQQAIDWMKDHTQGFCLQIEGGKVDWAAHANDAAALIYDQVAFDDAVKVAIDFAEKDGNTLVIITSDHGNANPGLYYGDEADKNFEKIFTFKHTNDWVLLGFDREGSIASLSERIHSNQNYQLSNERLTFILDKYKEQKSEGVYNSYKLPFKEYADYQRDQTSIAFGGMEHSGDFTELAMFGPGSERMKPFMVNTDLHYFMLQVAEVENKF
jgi:alkaline phosphatase